MKIPSLSLCLIAKNEEHNVPRLFKSIEGCFDEIILVDTGSTDKTVEVAEKLGAKIHHFEWIHDFAAARNFAFSQATSDFTMWLDLDDVLEGREEFLKFKEHALNLADYFIARYDYSSDPTGKAVCSFARERIIRNGLDMNWRYFVHEGILPTSPFRDVRIQYIPTWSVRHKRTEEDLRKDRSRNLEIFEKHLGKSGFDSRMRYYYGKELFEAGKPFDSIQQFGMAFADKALEFHDRVLGMQYCCYAFQQCNQYEKAIDLASTALQISPHRAEFYVIIGDSYLKLGQIQNALPAFNAAKSCFYSDPTQASPIFSSEDAYTVYPRNQISRILANLGDFKKAKGFAEDTFSEFKHPETKVILDEIVRIMKLSDGYKTAEACEDIVITCPPVSAYPFDPGLAQTKSMGGSETALIEMAHHLHHLSKRPVKVFNMRDKPETFDGVEYLPATQASEYMSKNKPYLHVAWRHNIKLTDAPTFVWSHDLQTPGVENTNNYTKVMCLTPFHARYMHATQGVPESKIWVTRNGIKPERFDESLFTETRDPYRFVFPNSPDRGLDRCMRVLDRVREHYPLVTLEVFYGIEHLPKYGHQALHDKLRGMMEERKDWVIYRGATQQDELMKAFRQASYWLSPSDWIETSCISAMEIVLSGVYPIYRGIGGVVDTLKQATELGMATPVFTECVTELDYAQYVQATLEAISENRQARVKLDPKELAWERVAQSWLTELPKMV